MKVDTVPKPIERSIPDAEVSLPTIAERLTHKIRNPLSVIITAASQLQESDSNPNDHDQRSFVQAIQTAAEQIEDNLKRFCLYACPEPPVMEAIDLNELCRAEKDNYQSQSESASPVPIEFHPDHDLSETVCDHYQIRIALTELINNAVQATQLSGSVIIGTRQSGRTISITIDDDGHGIPDEYTDKILLPFFTTRPGGCGLGLAITERILTAHRGTIKLECRSCGGTRVIVTLPCGDYIKE